MIKPFASGIWEPKSHTAFWMRKWWSEHLIWHRNSGSCSWNSATISQSQVQCFGTGILCEWLTIVAGCRILVQRIRFFSEMDLEHLRNVTLVLYTRWSILVFSWWLMMVKAGGCRFAHNTRSFVELPSPASQTSQEWHDLSLQLRFGVRTRYAP